MRKTLGPIVIDTKPPYREWDGNQATYLFFPVFASFLLVLLSGLSEPIVSGLSVARVNTGVNGTMSFGTWGWCTRGVPGVDDMCSGDRGFGVSLESQMDTVPAAMKSLAEVSTAIPASYLIANGVFHIFAALCTWLTTTSSLVASGAWHSKEAHAWSWTRQSFYGTLVSAVFIAISWGLDLGMMTRIADKAVNLDGSQPQVTPGPAIWLMMVAFLLNIITFAVRMFWLRTMPRPLWSVQGGGGDFHNAMPPPMSAALPPPDELPPTWESLNIHSAAPVDDKAFEAQYEQAIEESARRLDGQRHFAL